MTPSEFKEIAKAMQDYGITHVKMGDCEINCAYPAHGEIKIHNTAVPTVNPVQDPSDPIKHKVDQMTSLMKLSDTDLVDQLFPDKSEEAI